MVKTFTQYISNFRTLGQIWTKFFGFDQGFGFIFGSNPGQAGQKKLHFGPGRRGQFLFDLTQAKVGQKITTWTGLYLAKTFEDPDRT